MTNFKYYILQIVLLTLVLIFINNAVHANNIKNSAVVYMYHKFDTQKYPSTNITLEQFEAHLLEFKKTKYTILPLDYIIDIIINDGKLPDNTIGISVDDADRSFLTTAWPRFKEMGFPVTLFVSTSTIIKGNKNYLNWNEIRKLEKEGVLIGAHSHTHGHPKDFTLKELKNEIEKSNKIFLKELGKIPSIFAYPYGEANKNFFDILNDYKFKAAFGQHSGVVNETSNLYYLPRFSLNEKYGEIDRLQFTAQAKGLGVYDFVPNNPQITENPPYIGFSLLDVTLAKTINCFVFDSDGQVESDTFKFSERIEIRLNRKLKKGRSRLNCTARDSQNNWRWFGNQFYL